MVEHARVWLDAEQDFQHLTVPPKDDAAHAWEGETICGTRGTLRWVTPENVDANRLCSACAAVTGVAPVLEGDHPGPV